MPKVKECIGNSKEKSKSKIWRILHFTSPFLFSFLVVKWSSELSLFNLLMPLSTNHDCPLPQWEEILKYAHFLPPHCLNILQIQVSLGHKLNDQWNFSNPMNLSSIFILVSTKTTPNQILPHCDLGCVVIKILTPMYWQ